MKKEMLFTLVVGGLMIFSVVGYAASGLKFSGEVVKDQSIIPSIVEKPLVSGEKVQILRQGKVLIENIYDIECQDCEERNSELEMFTKLYSKYVVLETVATNETELFKFQMIGANGKIIELENEEIEQDNLLKLFCDVAVVKPRECLLMDY